MTVEWIDFLPQFNGYGFPRLSITRTQHPALSYGGRAVRFSRTRAWNNVRIDIVPARAGRYAVVLGFNTAVQLLPKCSKHRGTIVTKMLCT